MCEKAVDTYPSTVIHVCNCYKTQKICEKAVDTCPFMLYYVPDCWDTRNVWKSCF